VQRDVGFFLVLLVARRLLALGLSGGQMTLLVFCRCRTSMALPFRRRRFKIERIFELVVLELLRPSSSSSSSSSDRKRSGIPLRYPGRRFPYL
jgi:hypothetical protein